MELEFRSNEFEHLKTAYYEDFFFQHVEIVQLESEKIVLTSDFQGKFIQLIWDALIDFEKTATKDIAIKQYGKNKIYILSKEQTALHIKMNGEIFGTYSYEPFYEAFYKATKDYLKFIKGENPRLLLQEHYQQLAASCNYYERQFM